MASPKALKAASREKVGKGAARAVRRDNQIPAVIYGGGEAPTPISLDFKIANQLVYAGHFLTTVFEIEVGGKTIRALPRDYQLDRVKDTVVHIDFLRLNAGQTVRVFVPAHFVNHDQSPGIKQGGVLNVVRHEVEFVVPADAIPESITVDLSGLEINDAARISGVKLPEGVRPVIRDRDFVIANIAPPIKEEATPAADAAAAPAAAPAAEAKK
ncbi:MAG: 50S ribosomal protein L25/general stress protein Ctc [Rhizobiales bacterium 65-9]|nr:50S ribosomal protein L25/general stress protein Ctc [Hyphomicrobiales bacterium]OJY38602.1 MAG: 50S ribosomal protein L25/general stress protein Ctc [Rhizobiales bacterium 65-9]